VSLGANLITLPVLLPLLFGTLLLLVRGPGGRLMVGALASSLTLLASVAIAARVFAGEVLAVQMGGWPAPYGITLVADGLSGVMLLLSSVTALLTVLFAGPSLRVAPQAGLSPALNRTRERFGVQALLQFLFMGVNMSFLSGDLFNLFVAFEVMLIASYGLLLIGGELPQLREGFKYVVINLTVSTVFVLAAGLAYGLLGTLNLADMARLLAGHGPDGRVTVVALLLALVFATKAALFPFGFWLAYAYPTPPAVITAFFGAVLTKVGAYALVRAFTLLFAAEADLQAGLLAFAGVNMLFGGLGAVAQGRWRHALAFANIASIGYILMGLFVGTPASLAAAVYYMIHSVLVIFAIFLVAALAEQLGGRDYRLGGVLERSPWLAGTFLFLALAIAGLPPTSGFIGKFALIGAALARGGAVTVAVAAAAVVAGLFLLYALIKAWRAFFWGEGAPPRVALPQGMVAVTAAAVALTVLLAVFSGPVFALAERVTAQLLDSRAYLAAVLLEGLEPGGP
jgi:multicomponent Na+:H+ antiporter subunit D